MHSTTLIEHTQHVTESTTFTAETTSTQCVLVELYMDTDWMDSNGYKLAELYNVNYMDTGWTVTDVNAPSHFVFPV